MCIFAFVAKNIYNLLCRTYIFVTKFSPKGMENGGKGGSRM